MFLDRKPPGDLDGLASGVQNESLKPAAREIFIHYPEGMGVSKLAFGRDLLGTTRNMNTVRKLAEMAP